MTCDYDSLRSAIGLQGKLKPSTCPSCAADGYSALGVCKKCLENRAWNREYMETHAFIYDDQVRRYHNDRHDNIKQLPLRLENEHPFLYYGAEIEVGFDSDITHVYQVESDDYDEEDTNGGEDIAYVLSEFSKITEGMFVYEEDSTLTNGVEFISRPCSYAYWTHPDTVKKLEKGFNFLKEQGAWVEQPLTHGMHIHLSQKFFRRGRMNVTTEEAKAEFNWLFQKFQPELEKLGGRKWTEWCEGKTDKARRSIANSLCGMDDVEVEAKCRLKKGGELPYGDHRSAINSTDNTIEVRIFRSTVDYKQILANIELVRAFAHAVREQDIKLSLDELLHTKETKFLDEHVQKTRMKCKKNGEELDLTKVNDDEIEFVVERK